MYFLGLDIGTSSCKALVTDEKGKNISYAYRGYSVIHPRTGWMELDAEMVWEKVKECISDCCRKGVGKDISAVAVSTQGEAVIPVSEERKALYGAIVTFDVRNKDEYEYLKAKADKQMVQNLTGAPIHPMFSITKMMWIKNALPDIYQKTWKLLCFGDYISMKLGADPYIDYTMASRTLAFDIHKMQWSREILSISGIDISLLPEVVPSGQAIGQIDQRIADVLGLNKKAVIVSGAHDQICCALGAGVMESGIAMDSLGTTESILCIRDRAVITSDMVENNIPCYPYALPGFYAYLTFLSCCGSVLDWYKNTILEDSAPFSDFDAVCTEKEPAGIFVLPHFAGAGTPYLDFESKGVIAGLTLGTSRIEIYKAIMEGTCYEMLINLEVMKRSGIIIDELRCIGGGSKSDFWMQLKADITGKPITVMKTKEAGCLGAAILASSGYGFFDNPADPVKTWVSPSKTFLPDMSLHNLYMEAFEQYKPMYELSRKTVSR